MTNNFFMIVGAQKCGTTSLANWLDQHPDISMSNPKEPRFFEREYPYGKEWYLENYFKGASGKLLGEARVHNLTVKYIPQRIIEFNPDTKIIVMMRDPVKRYISAWNHFRVMRPGREVRSLEKAIFDSIKNFDLDYFNSEERFCSNLDICGGPFRDMYFETGFYMHYIENYRYFGFEIMPVIFESLIITPKIWYRKILDFLEVDEFTPEFNALNVKEYRKFESETKLLKELYIDSVRSVSDYVGINLRGIWK